MHPFVCVQVCMCLVLRNFITCLASCNYCHIGYMELVYHCRTLEYCPFIAKPPHPTPLTLPHKTFNFKNKQRASLVAQWLRIRLPMQGTRVRALVLEDPTSRGATKPMCHNY